MTDERKTSEELIREARNRLSSGGDLPGPSETPLEKGGDSVLDGPAIDAAPVEEPPRFSRSETTGPEERVESTEVDPATWQPDYLEPGPPRRPFFTTRWFRLAILVAIGLGYGFFTSLDDANRDASGEIISGGDLDVMTVQPGDCFNDPSDEDEVVFQLEAIPCSQPHDNEVFAVESVAGLFGSEYPGRQILEEHAYEVCSGPVFDSYVGTPYLDSSLEVFTLTPTDDSWSQGDRDVVCVLYKLDFTKLNEPARSSGL